MGRGDEHRTLLFGSYLCAIADRISTGLSTSPTGARTNSPGIPLTNVVDAIDSKKARAGSTSSHSQGGHSLNSAHGSKDQSLTTLPEEEQPDADLLFNPDGSESEMLLNSKLCAATPFSAALIDGGFVFCVFTPFAASSKSVSRVTPSGMPVPRYRLVVFWNTLVWTTLLVCLTWVHGWYCIFRVQDWVFLAVRSGLHLPVRVHGSCELDHYGISAP